MIVGLSTEGTPHPTGCNVGFSTYLAKATGGGKFYRFWDLPHQLDLIIKAGLHAIADDGDFEFVKVATTLIVWLRRQVALVRRMGSKYSYYISVRRLRTTPLLGIL